jgi:hypothetical protein
LLGARSGAENAAVVALRRPCQVVCRAVVNDQPGEFRPRLQHQSPASSPDAQV